MEITPEVIKEMSEAVGGDTQLAAKLNVTAQAVYLWKREERKIKKANAIKVRRLYRKLFNGK